LADSQIGRLETQAEVARQYKDLHGQLGRRQKPKDKCRGKGTP